MLSTIVLAGCGGALSSTAEDAECVDGTTLAAHGIADGIAIAARDDRFEPICIETSAARVTIVLRNAGSHPHNLRLEGGRHVSVDAGQVGVLADVNVQTGGTTFVCTLHSGMSGTIVPVSD